MFSPSPSPSPSPSSKPQKLALPPRIYGRRASLSTRMALITSDSWLCAARQDAASAARGVFAGATRCATHPHRPTHQPSGVADAARRRPVLRPLMPPPLALPLSTCRCPPLPTPLHLPVHRVCACSTASLTGTQSAWLTTQLQNPLHLQAHTAVVLPFASGVTGVLPPFLSST